MRLRRLTRPLRRAAGDIRVALLALALAAAYSLTVPELIRGEDLCPPGQETLPPGECEDCSPRPGGEGGWLFPMGCCYEMRGEEEWTSCLYHPQQEPCEGGGSW